LAAEIKKAKGRDTELVKGSGGIFDVYDGEKLIFSKHAEHRFPEADEIVDELD
jgi:predicted Rdx family selenoprotein